MQPHLSLRHLSFSAIVAGFVSVLVGYTGSIAIVVQALQASSVPASEIGGWLTMLGLAMGVSSLGLSLYYRIPILTAWSTPGMAVLATSAVGVPLNEVVGIFIFAAGLMLLCGVTGIFARIMQRIPQSLAAAMLAGILLRFCLEAFLAFELDLLMSGLMCLVFLVSRRYAPRYAIVLTLLVGVALAAGKMQGMDFSHQDVISWPSWVTPKFEWASLVGVGIPFFIVSMGSQNAPGIATLQAFGYTPRISPLISITALLSLVLSPLGGFSVCIAAISAAFCLGPEAHADQSRRYMAAACAGIFYLLAGIFGASIGVLFSNLPEAFIKSIAGLALLGTFTSSVTLAMKDEERRDAAAITFLVTASGLSLWGISSAFWGMVGGGLTYFIMRRRSA
ncbi:benzoate/H(+) symporter BenE family transporter [Paenalcaligenes sp. Me131]|uniref:benzoate/H(+) symporter BenE family transporter n=1 Tax=Paenalcaligenes sp. Me131 TaxID=3392636 RepID=UPI003D27DB76